MKRALSLMLSILTVLTLFAGCAAKPADPQPAGPATDPAADPAGTNEPAPAADNGRRATNEIVVGISQDLDNSLDPHQTVSAGTKELMFNVFEGLVKPTPDGELIPAVAESYELSDDLTSYIFKLRDGVKFHNGKTVTMDDVLYSLTRCRDEGYVPALADTDISGEGDTLTITLPAPNNEFLAYLTCAIIPADYDAQATAPVGTGPFKFVSRQAQQNVVLERFDDYWGEKAHLDRVTYLIYENPEALVLALKGGAVDLYSHLSVATISQLGADFTILEGTMNLVQAVYLNHDYEPLKDVRVRQALCYAFDRQTLFDLTAGGRGWPVGSSMYPAFKKYYREDLNNLYPHNVERAKELLAEAGYPNGFDLTIKVPSNYDPHVDAGQIAAELFRAVGVNVTVEPVDWTTWVNDVYKGRNFEATVCGFDASTMTARALLERFTTGNSKNFINYSNPEYDAAFVDAQTAKSDDVQTRAYLEMEGILAKDAANVYIQDLVDFVALRKGLTGYRFYPIYVMDMSTIRYE
ncbi:MAG: ABC transporter substrate-binding protein [Ruminococcaceae bacterium]|jgi:peptide/nickel transport system substrate-binding protein|nr:ABC transporter substrate-binding protein [Oscillospiraceae bacterium]